MFARRLNHLSIRYIFNRIKVIVDERVNPEHPWLTRDAVKLLDSLIKPTDVGVEFGSGRSTVWFARRLKSLVSVENDDVWHNKVSNKLKKQGLNSIVDYRYVQNLDLYFKQAKDFANNSVDFCLIDGVVRDECALAMIDKIRKGGILVIDNVNWFLPNQASYSPDSITAGKFASEAWKEFYLRTKSWRSVWTTNGVTETCIFIRI